MNKKNLFWGFSGIQLWLPENDSSQIPFGCVPLTIQQDVENPSLSFSSFFFCRSRNNLITSSYFTVFSVFHSPTLPCIKIPIFLFSAFPAFSWLSFNIWCYIFSINIIPSDYGLSLQTLLLPMFSKAAVGVEGNPRFEWIAVFSIQFNLSTSWCDKAQVTGERSEVGRASESQ